LLLQLWALRQSFQQSGSFQTVGRSVSLRDHSQTAAFESEDDRDSDESFVADLADFDAFAIGLSRQN
jgi:hypothetical protein